MLRGVYDQNWLYTPDSTGWPPSQWVAPYSNNPVLAYETGQCYQYMPNPKAYLCPLDYKSKYYAQRPNWLSSYKMNAAVEGYPDVRRLITKSRVCKIADVWSTSCYLFWEEDENFGTPPIAAGAYFNAASDPVNSIDNYPDAAVGYHHGSGAIVLSLDGHAGFLTYNSFLHDLNTTNRGLVWWSPWSKDGH